MKKFIKISTLIIITIFGLYLTTSTVLPRIIDKKYNKVIQLPPYKVSKEAQLLVDSLDFISDLHCDALLWKRDLLKTNNFGQVDIPRMIQSNIALQTFTIVTKVPKKINFDKNTDETDAITIPFILEGRPLKSWFNLTERALVQTKCLHEFSKKSNESFQIIKSKSDLHSFIKKRQQNKKITAGFIGIEGMHALSGEIKNIDILYNAGVRMMSPVHFFDNELGGSAHGVTHSGLTDFGKKVIKKMQSKGIIVDVAHSSKKC